MEGTNTGEITMPQLPATEVAKVETVADVASDATATEKSKDTSAPTGDSTAVGQPESVNKKRKLFVKSFSSLAQEAENLPELKKLFGDNILEGTTVLFPAERGVGKTFAGLQICMAVAAGYTEYLGEPIELHGNTLFINMELSQRIMSKRLSKLQKNLKRTEGCQYEAYCISDRFNFLERLDELEQYIMKYRPVLVVVDNLRTAFNESNNEKNREMATVIIKLNQLRDRYGFALVLVHHTKKGSGSQRTSSDLQSGAGAISDLVDGDFFLRKSNQDKNLRLLKRAKSRNCEEQEGSKLIRLNPETLWFELVEDNVDESLHIYALDSPAGEKAELIQQAVQLRKEGKTVAEIGAELGRNKSTISRILKKAGMESEAS